MPAASVLPTNRDQKEFYKVSDTPRELTDEDLAFISQYTGKSKQAMRSHAIDVWRTTKERLWAFKCIQDIHFLTPKISLHPNYKAVSTAHKQSSPNKQLLHVDVGCCYGQDTRQLIVDGWKQEELAAIDLVPDYWNLGKVLFMDEDRLSVPFLAGSMADATFISVSNPKGTPTELLIGAADFCWAGAVLHCLSKADCETFLTSALAVLKPGGSFYGTTAGFPTAREHVPTPDGKAKRFFHSPESLKEMMQKVGFSKVDVELGKWSMLGMQENDETLTSKHDENMILLCFTGVK